MGAVDGRAAPMPFAQQDVLPSSLIQEDAFMNSWNMPYVAPAMPPYIPVNAACLIRFEHPSCAHASQCSNAHAFQPQPVMTAMPTQERETHAPTWFAQIPYSPQPPSTMPTEPAVSSASAAPAEVDHANVFTQIHQQASSRPPRWLRLLCAREQP